MNKSNIITTEIVDLYSELFNKEQYVNFFSQKNIYISSNFKDGKIRTSIRLGDLGGTPVNSWEEESQQSDVFLISEVDYENLNKNIYSDEVCFISSLLLKKQTKIDDKEKILTSRIMIVREDFFLDYLNIRSSLIGKHLNNLQDYEIRKQIFSLLFL